MRLAPESVEALAARIAELLGAADSCSAEGGPKRMLTAAQVAERWGVARRWVYDHAEALGARRLGGGPRPRLRFDPEEVAERLGAPAPRPSRGGDGRRLTAMRANPHSDSLSVRRRATVGGQGKQTAGRRCNAPGPAPKEVLRHTGEPSPARPSAPDHLPRRRKARR
jgi:hypothetical protein